MKGPTICRIPWTKILEPVGMFTEEIDKKHKRETCLFFGAIISHDTFLPDTTVFVHRLVFLFTVC